MTSEDSGFPDSAVLLRPVERFIERVEAVDFDADDISGQLSYLLGFAKNFYLQFFSFEHETEITAIDRAARRRVRPIERELRSSGAATQELRLFTHFVTLVEFLEADDAGLSGGEESNTADRRRRILEDVGELLERIAEWAEHRGLNRLHAAASSIATRFSDTVEALDEELGYDDA